MLLRQNLGWDPWGKKVCRGRRCSARAERIQAQRPYRHNGSIIGLIYGYDLGSVASALLFLALALVSFAFVYALAPETRGRPLQVIRTYWYNGGPGPRRPALKPSKTGVIPSTSSLQTSPSFGASVQC
jgi:hypothetical protein